MKKCFSCGKKKPLEDFARNTEAKDGRVATCKKCQNEKYRSKCKTVKEKWSYVF